ncbi:hypothetical protein DV736_g494, partial [Chaetothyriales sp. CBS 134916]
MPRRKSAAATTPKSHKRQLSSNIPASSSPGTRASKRLRESAGKATVSAKPKKSNYFEEPDSGEDNNVESSSEEADRSGYEEDGSAVEDSATDDANEDDSGDVNTAVAGGNQDLWREGVKTGLGPGKQVFIEKPKPRGDGGVKYAPDRIHPNTMLFLSELKKNNDRQWLKLHDPDYRKAWKDWESTVETLSEKIAEVDETVPELPAKDLTHFSAAWLTCTDYFQIGPDGRSFVGSGLWMPEAGPLALLRNDIDQNPGRLRAILTDPGIRKHIFNGVTKDENAIEAFTLHNGETDNPNIELLRLRSFTMGKRLSEGEVLAPNALSRITELITVMVPFTSQVAKIG